MNGKAFLDMTAEVQDTAGHAEQKTLSLSVSQNELEITAIPEAGALVPGIENILYILASYPDGRPAPGKVFVDGTAYQSDAQEVCEAKIVPADLNQQFEIRAIEQGGKQRKLTYRSETNRAPPAFLLRADKAVYQVGQTAHISVNSAEKNDTIYLDVIKDGQTVLTKSVSLSNHQADYALTLPV
jgi:hypothetical protein